MRVAVILALLGSAAAFAPAQFGKGSTALSMAPSDGKPAASHEEDLDKTFKVCVAGLRVLWVGISNACVGW